MHKRLTCFSDLLQYDVNDVYAFQYTIIHEFIKKELDKITKINYFSDEAASQYNNYKNFTNLLHHADDFHISGEWHWRHNQASSCIQQSTKSNNWLNLNSQRPF